jgi:DNA-directed RNA polymerase subunit RPC12/RpoP
MSRDFKKKQKSEKMKFEIYHPDDSRKTRGGYKIKSPAVRLTATRFVFNVAASQIIKGWKKITLAYDKKSGCFAITKTDKGLKVLKSKYIITVSSIGIIKFFSLQNIVGRKYALETSGNYFLLKPIIGKITSKTSQPFPQVPENKISKTYMCKDCSHTDADWANHKPQRCPKCGGCSIEELILKKRLEV